MPPQQLLYLLLATLIWLLGYLHNGKFVRPKWKIPGKFLFYLGISAALVHWWEHWSLVFIIGHPLLGFLFHLKVCRNHDIHWLTCTPQDQYIALQEKWAKGDFGSSNKDH